ncbi:MAG: hypothetical protein AAF542_24810 [Pseudomonadota bacterium]
MISCVCVVQEGQTADLRRAAIQDAINSFCQNSFHQSAELIWHVVPRGNGFTGGGNPSTSSVVALTLEEGIDQIKRERLLKALSGLWCGWTDTSSDELVAVISDPR